VKYIFLVIILFIFISVLGILFLLPVILLCKAFDILDESYDNMENNTKIKDKSD
jgi:hypothetical protein